MQISVKIDQADLQRLMSALDGVQSVVKIQGGDTMQWKCATDYYQLVMENMLKRNSPRPAYSKRYRNWKYEYGWMGYPSPWRLRGDLMRSLGSYRYGDGYLGGVQPGAMDSGGKSWFGKGRLGPSGKIKSIEMYGNVEEARRPLFEPTMEEYAGAGWLKRGDEMLGKIESRWR
jgi:hypothetical protein